MKSEIDSGFVGSLRATLAGEVLTDFIKLTRVILEEKGDEAKNVASVLAAAAFEDTMRKLADIRKCEDGEKLADVIMQLKNAGILQGAQVCIAQSYLSLRNRALHAKWGEVDRPSIESLLAFTEQIILKSFTWVTMGSTFCPISGSTGSLKYPVTGEFYALHENL